VYIII